MIEDAREFSNESFGKCPACGGAMHVEGQDPMSAVNPDRILGESKALQRRSDNSRFATRLRCERGHRYWILTEEARATV